MLDLTRRSFVAAAAAVFCWLWLAGPAAAQRAPHVRYDARSPKGQAMLKIYAKAVAKMKSTAEGNPEGWTFQWYTHWVKGSTTKAAEIKRIYPKPNAWRALAQEMWNTCQAHGPGEDENDFLPWHRMFVYYFENIIRDVSGDRSFTLPYWNYSATNLKIRGVIPPEFTRKKDPLFKSLYVENRNPGVNAGKPIQQGQPGDPLSLEALAQCLYEPHAPIPGFCMDLDFGLHGNVHVLVGNPQNMGSVPWAANDPIFWMHHCNIDRLWASWNAAKRKNPPLSGTFVFATKKGKVVAKVSDFLDTAKLGYRYDHLEPVPDCPTPKKVLVAAAQQHKRIATVKAKEIKLGAEPVKVPLEPLPEKEGEKPVPLTARVKALPEGKHLYLVVKNLRTDVQPGVLYHLYLELPPGATGEKAKPHYVGVVNFFHAAGHGGHEKEAKKGPERFYRFDVTEVARSLHAKNLLSDRPTLTIAPAGQPAAEANPVIGEITLIEQ